MKSYIRPRSASACQCAHGKHEKPPFALERRQQDCPEQCRKEAVRVTPRAHEAAAAPPQGESQPLPPRREQKQRAPAPPKGRKKPSEAAQDKEDLGVLDAEELEALKEEEAENANPRKCHCFAGKPQDCGSSVGDKAVSSVCRISDDLRAIYHLHKWELSRRLNTTLHHPRRREPPEGAPGEQAPPADAGEGGEEEAEPGLEEKAALRGSQHRQMFPNRQQEQIAQRILGDHSFRKKLIRKMRDSYGRRFKLPKPFDKFNDLLASQDEYRDRDEEDGYLAVLSTVVLSAIRSELSPSEDYMQKKNLFYSKQNHEHLRPVHDHFRNESLHFLPLYSPDLRFGSCAVVGNSGGLRDDELGPQIDQHEIVIRTNQAPSFQYERHVGSKTGMRLVNKRWTDELGRRHIDLLDHDSSDVMVVSSRANVREFVLLARALRRTKPRSQLFFLSSRVVTQAMRFIRTFRKGINAGLPRHPRGGNTASSGFLAVFLALQFCQTLDVYGFSLEECRSGGCARDYHYFRALPDSPWLRAHPSHSFELEGLILKAMHIMGIACVFPSPAIGGQCGSRLGGVITPSGRLRAKKLDLLAAMSDIGVPNVTSLPRRISSFYGAAAARAGAG